MTKISTLFFLLLLSVSCQSRSSLRAEIEQVELPVLTCKEFNPLFKIVVIGDSLPLGAGISSLLFDFGGTTDLGDIARVELFGVTDQGYMDRSDGSLLCLEGVGDSRVRLLGDVRLRGDTTCFWLSVTLCDRVDLDNRISAQLLSIDAYDGQVLVDDYQAKALRTGVALRQHGQDGVDTSRIPGLVTSTTGTLLAIYDARWDSSRDLQGDIDIGLNRSLDGGETWLPMQIAIDMGEWGGLPQKYNGVSDGTLLVDALTGDIYITGLWMHGVLDGENGQWIEGLTPQSDQWIHQWHSRGSQAGLDPKQTSQFMIVKSVDDGLTWSEPVNITSQTKRSQWWLFAPAPGHGITLSDGTLVLPTQGRDSVGLPFSNITYSLDRGESWITSNPAYDNTTEWYGC